MALTLRHFKQRIGIEPTLIAQNRRAVRVIAASRRALRSYRPQPYAGQLVYFRASIPSALQFDATLLWSRLAGDLLVYQVAGHHDDLLRGSVAELGRLITVSLASPSDRYPRNFISGRNVLAENQNNAATITVRSPDPCS